MPVEENEKLRRSGKLCYLGKLGKKFMEALTLYKVKAFESKLGIELCSEMSFVGEVLVLLKEDKK